MAPLSYEDKLRKSKERNKQNFDKNKALINDLKLERGCDRCGYNAHPAALDFNHLDPAQKSFTVSTRLQQYCWKRLEQEIAKCEILCANCHRIHSYETHYTRMGSDGTPSSSPITGTGT